MRKDAYYFPHDSNAKDDPKCVLLIEQLGLEGYGIYWVLIETLRDQPDYKYPLALVSALARRYNTTTEKMKAVINGYGLFTIDENDFFSESLIERMEEFEYKKEIARLAGKASAEKRRLLNSGSTDVQQPFNDGSTIREDKSKVNKTIYIKEYTSNDSLKDAIEAFVEMRIKIKKPLTDRAIKMAFKELDKLANSDDEKIAVLNQSTLNCWQGLFPLKGGSANGTNKPGTDGESKSAYPDGKVPRWAAKEV